MKDANKPKGCNLYDGLARVQKYFATFLFVLFGLVFSVLAHASQLYGWEAIEGCKCGLGDSVVKNQSVGVLFSRTSSIGAPVGFPIDFSGLNRVSFQVKNVFFDHSNNSLRIEKNHFKFAEAEEFIKLANSYNTYVDLLISSAGGRARVSTVEIDSGDIVILANDIARILKENPFDGLTIDLERLFNNDTIAYRLLVQELVKSIEAQKLHNIKHFNVIISHKDLPKLRKDIGDKYHLPKHQSARLLLRFLDKGLDNIGVQGNLFIRSTQTRKLNSKSYLASECGIDEGPVIEASLEYSEYPKKAPLMFPENRIFPLVSLKNIQDKLKNIKSENDFCRISFFNEFIINKYLGLAFEDMADNQPSKGVVTEPLGKWYPHEHLEKATSIKVDKSSSQSLVSENSQNKQSEKIKHYGQWDDLDLFAPVEDREKMHFLKRLQQEYLPNFCQKLCPYQRLFLISCLSLLAALLVFVIASNLSYKLNLLFKRLPLVVYLLLFLLLAGLIQALTLCEYQYVMIKNATLIFTFSVLVISRLIDRYSHDVKGHFP